MSSPARMVLRALLVFIIASASQVFAQSYFPSFSTPTVNTNIQMMGGGGPALVNVGGELQMVYVNIYGDLEMAYATDGHDYTDEGPISYDGHTIQINCQSNLSDNCAAGAALYNGQLYVAYPSASCDCLHVLAGTESHNAYGVPEWTWSWVVDGTGYNLVSTPALVVTTDGSNNLIIRYGTTVGAYGDDVYSTVLYNDGAWSTQKADAGSPTQDTLFSVNGINYVIDREICCTDVSEDQVNVAEMYDNGVDIIGTGVPLPGSDASPSGFSSAVVNNLENTVLVATYSPYDGEDLQLLEGSTYYGLDTESWGNQIYTNIVGTYGPGYNEFAIAQFGSPNEVAIVYRGDSNGDLYSTFGYVPNE